MYNYCSTCAFMHNFTSTNVGIFLVKMCISQHFFYFALADTRALTNFRSSSTVKNDLYHFQKKRLNVQSSYQNEEIFEMSIS